MAEYFEQLVYSPDRKSIFAELYFAILFISALFLYFSKKLQKL